MEQQIELLRNISYYEEAYKSTVRLMKAAPSIEVQASLFNTAKYYQQKIQLLRKELRSV